MTAPASSPPPLKEAVAAVTAEAVTELDPVWHLHPGDVSKALFDVLPHLVDRWALASASVAADWYDELRATNAIRGRFTAIVPPLDNLGAEALAGWGSQPLKQTDLNLVPLKKIQPIKTISDLSEPVHLDEPNPDGTLSALDSSRLRVEGGLQKRIVNAANVTVTGSAVADPHARGWMRRTQPGACGFCLLVASRGGVYTKATATFACHEHCYCEAVPAWGGQALPVDPYKPSSKQSSPADRARVRQWIKDNL